MIVVVFFSDRGRVACCVCALGCSFPSWTTSGQVGYEIGISIKKLFAGSNEFHDGLAADGLSPIDVRTPSTMTAEKWVAAAASASTKQRPPTRNEGTADSPRPGSSKDWLKWA